MLIKRCSGNTKIVMLLIVYKIDSINQFYQVDDDFSKPPQVKENILAFLILITGKTELNDGLLIDWIEIKTEITSKHSIEKIKRIFLNKELFGSKRK